MKKTIPRGKTPSLIGSTLGRPKQIDVRRRSSCKRCSDAIEIGDVCFGIPRLGGAFANEGRYCQSCYSQILKQTQADVADLTNYLRGLPANRG
jgi:hypothetical protein